MERRLLCNALFLTFQNLANSNLVKDKATVDVYVGMLLSNVLWCSHWCMATLGALINISAWASALLVLTRRAVLEPRKVGRADRCFPRSFCFCPNQNLLNALTGIRG